MYGFSYAPPPRTCQLCPTPISQHAKYCQPCMQSLSQARTRVIYTVLKRLEEELPMLLRQIEEHT